MGHPKVKTVRELRKFAAIMTVIPGLFAALAWYRNRELVSAIVGGISCFFLLAGVVAPRALAPVERAWLWLGESIGKVVTPIILILAYMLVITPMGILVRLLGKDLLDLRIDRSSQSYWREVEKDGPGTRPFLPY